MAEEGADGPSWAAQWPRGPLSESRQHCPVPPGHTGIGGPGLGGFESGVLSIGKIAQRVVMKHDPSFCFWKGRPSWPTSATPFRERVVVSKNSL